MWNTTCNICGKVMSGTPSRCIRCGADLKKHGHSIHYNVALQPPSNPAEMDTRIQFLLTRVPKMEPEEAQRRVLSHLVSRAKVSAKYVVPYENEKPAVYIDEDGKFYLAICLNNPISEILNKKTDYKITEVETLIEELIDNPIIDGIMIDPYREKFYLDGKAILAAFGINNNNRIDKYREDALNQEFYIKQVSAELIDSLPESIKQGVIAPGKQKLLKWSIETMVQKEYVDKLSVAVDRESLMKRISMKYGLR